MRFITPKLTPTVCFSQSILALTVFKKGLPKIMGQMSSCGVLITRKSVGYFIFAHKTSTSLRIPIGDIVSLLASLIVTSMSYISAGATSSLISWYKEKGIALTLASMSHKPW